MNIQKAIHDLEASLEIIHANAQLFHAGNKHTYRVVATELRKLLCDGRTREDSLIPRLFNIVRFHPLLGYVSAEENADYKRRFGVSRLDGLIFQMPAEVSFDGKGGCKIERLFNVHAKPLDLEMWLQQPLLSERVTIRELIRSVADKEAAHSDKDYNEALRLAKSVQLVDEDSHLKFVIAIGEYVLQAVSPALVELKKRNTASQHGVTRQAG